MFVLLFAYVFGGAITVRGGNYREYIIGRHPHAVAGVRPDRPGDRDRHRPHRGRHRPLPFAAGVARSAYVAGHYVAELAGMALSIVVLLGAGLLVGWRTHTDLLHIATALVLLLAFASAMIWIGTWIGLLVRSPDAVMGVGFVVVFPLTFLSNAFVPINSLPTSCSGSRRGTRSA